MTPQYVIFPNNLFSKREKKKHPSFDNWLTNKEGGDKFPTWTFCGGSGAAADGLLRESGSVRASLLLAAA